MKKLSMLLAFSLLSLGVASASDIPCSITGTSFNNPIDISTVVTCTNAAGQTLLTFSNFEVLDPTNGAAGTVDILGQYLSNGIWSGSEYDTVANQVYLNMNPNLGPGANNQGQDTELVFEVTGGVTEVDMSVGGVNATVGETVCTVQPPTSGSNAFLCPTADQLGQLVVSSESPDQPVFQSLSGVTSPIWIQKDMNTGPGGQLSAELTQSFGPSIPEPVSMVLLGSGLLGLGLLRRRSRKS
jgi:hypothetical protein